MIVAASMTTVWLGLGILLGTLGCSSERPTFRLNESATDESTSASLTSGDSGLSAAMDTRVADAAENLLQLAEPCTGDGDCESGACADGVCCAAPCAEICATCSAPGQEGKCIAAINDPLCEQLACPPDTDCREHVAANATQACLAIGKCQLDAACEARNEPPGTPCRNGGGACNESGECIVASKLIPGESCTDANDCDSGFCAASEGTFVCCETACDKVCEACGADGSCNERPVDDQRCDVVTCPENTPCSTYSNDLTTDRCVAVGTCATQATHCNADHAEAGTTCGDGLVCDGQGECGPQCAASELWCSAACVNPLSDGKHCGGCGTECGASLFCNDGKCAPDCAASHVACGIECVDPMTNEEHCGATADCVGRNAGEVCSAPFACRAGACEINCMAGQISCDGSCINPLTNDTFCGASLTCTAQNRGQTCATGYACEAGVCRLQCQGKEIPCAGSCIDPDSDERFCGASDYCEGGDVGQECESGSLCLLGMCRAPDGQPCEVGVDCISGVCSPFYLDLDGDGYGAESSGIERVCGNAPPGFNYFPNNLDCCDQADVLSHAADANPDFVSGSAALGRTYGADGCAKPFDWNCDGVETREINTTTAPCSSFTTQATCPSGRFDTAIPNCGFTAIYNDCIWDGTSCGNGQGGPLTQRCY